MIQVEKDLMELSFGGNKDFYLNEVNFFFFRSSSGIWKFFDLIFICNICDMKFFYYLVLLSYKVYDYGLLVILKVVSGEQFIGMIIVKRCRNCIVDFFLKIEW